MDRRSFLQVLGLVAAPVEPRRAYSFLWAPPEVDVFTLDHMRDAIAQIEATNLRRPMGLPIPESFFRALVETFTEQVLEDAFHDRIFPALR